MLLDLFFRLVCPNIVIFLQKNYSNPSKQEYLAKSRHACQLYTAQHDTIFPSSTIYTDAVQYIQMHSFA